MKTFYALPLITATLLFVSGFAPVSAQSLSSSSNSLPPLLMSFSGSTVQNNPVLSWTMENETNSKWFVIERSANGINFDSTGVVIGLNNAQETDYTYTDINSPEGSNYYRLRIVDRDGITKYSKVISLLNTNTITNMQIFPNPASIVVNYAVNSPKSDQVTIEVFNMAGVKLISQQQQLSAGLNRQSIAISALKGGNYFLKIINRQGNNQYVQSFVKLM